MSGRATLNFGRNFLFALERPSATAAGTTCSFAQSVANQTCTGGSLHQDTNHWTPEDCRLSCCADPECLVWQYYARDMNSGRGHSNWAQGSCQHGGADVKCSAQPPTDLIGGMRKAFQPLPRDWNFVQPSFDDSTWVPVDIPHDFVINGSFAPDDDAHRGFLPRGVGRYRKRFKLPSSWQSRKIQLVFDAALQYAEIYLNGVHVADHRGGYTRFTVRLDNVTGIRYGDENENVLAVRVDARWGSGHWYEGGGITRSLYLESLPAVHFVTGGVFVSPVLGADGRQVSASAEIQKSEVSEVGGGSGGSSGGSGSSGSSAVRVSFVLRDRTGAAHEEEEEEAEEEEEKQGVVDGGPPLDVANVSCGFRSIDWGPKLKLNGKTTQLRGFSHHDNFAGVGVAMVPRIFLFRAQMQRAIGGNFWRMSHNPYEESIYGILDGLGVLVWDEQRDFWVSRVAEFRAMVKHHRSHPSIAIWGLCNEAECYPHQNSDPQGPNATVIAFKSAVKELAPDRPVAMNDNGFNDGQPGADYDVAGWSHSGDSAFSSFHDKFPATPQISSECCSCPSTSGYLPGLACMQGQNSPGLLPYVTGSIGVWTLGDYYGEQASWPGTVAGFGQFDLNGFPKPAALWYRENWLRRPNASSSSSSSSVLSDTAAEKRPRSSHAELTAAVTATRYARGAYQKMTLSVDVPSAASCTGDKVVLDGRDVALLRIALIDSDGHPTGAGAVSASSPALAPVTVTIAASASPEADSALAVARRSENCVFDKYIDSFYVAASRETSASRD
eukprot:g4759.t1